MSQEAKLPTLDDAIATLQQSVAMDVFFQKCAAAGEVPRTQEEALWMIETAEMLHEASQANQVKQASAEHSQYFEMRQKLASALGASGFSPHVADRNESLYRELAAGLAQNPEIFNAAVALKVAEAEKVAAALASR